jgi:hypothetical protein
MSAYPSTYLLSTIAEEKQRQHRTQACHWRRAKSAQTVSIADSGFHWTDLKRIVTERVKNPLRHHSGGSGEPAEIGANLLRPQFQA